MSQTLTDILVVIAAVFLVWLVIRLFRKPIRWILKLLLNTAIGFAALFLLNFFGSAIGITLGLNWINALVIGVHGLADRGAPAAGQFRGRHRRQPLRCDDLREPAFHGRQAGSRET